MTTYREHLLSTIDGLLDRIETQDESTRFAKAIADFKGLYPVDVCDPSMPAYELEYHGDKRIVINKRYELDLDGLSTDELMTMRNILEDILS